MSFGKVTPLSKNYNGRKKRNTRKKQRYNRWLDFEFQTFVFDCTIHFPLSQRGCSQSQKFSSSSSKSFFSFLGFSVSLFWLFLLPLQLRYKLMISFFLYFFLIQFAFLLCLFVSFVFSFFFVCNFCERSLLSFPLSISSFCFLWVFFKSDFIVRYFPKKN